MLNRAASAMCITPRSYRRAADSRAHSFLEQLFGAFFRWIVGREIALQIFFQQRTRFGQIALRLDVYLRALVEQPGIVWRDRLGPLKQRIALLNLTLLCQIAGEIDETPHLLRRHRHCASKLIFRSAAVLLLVGKLRLSVMIFRRIDLTDPLRNILRFIDAATQEAGRLQVIVEQIVEGFSIVRVQLNRFFEALARLYGVEGSGKGA